MQLPNKSTSQTATTLLKRLLLKVIVANEKGVGQLRAGAGNTRAREEEGEEEEGEEQEGEGARMFTAFCAPSSSGTGTMTSRAR